MINRFFFIAIVTMMIFLPCVSYAQGDEKSEIREQLAQQIINHFTPELQTYYEKQKDLYKKEHPVKPFVRYKQYTAYTRSAIPVSGSDLTRMLILANATLYSDKTAQEKIDRYCTDIGSANNCDVDVEVTEGGTPSDIREIIKQYHDDGGLDGVVIIGDQPVQWYYIKDPRFDPYSFACDLYYMDLDGSWEELNSKDEYTWHVDGDGDVEPEVFCSRIHPSSMSSLGSEVELLSTYLDKDHEYWIGNMELPQNGVAFVQETWAGYNNTVKNLYGDENTDLYESRDNANSTEYINTGLKGDYSFIQLWCHSSVHGHSFDWGGSISDGELFEIESNPIGYGIDACHIGAWPEGNGKYISGSYVFGKSKRALTILSGTRSGQSIGWEGDKFFEELGENICFGKAFIDWLGDYFVDAKGSKDYVDDRETKAWHYGYVIIGDPLITFQEINVTKAQQDNGFINKSEYFITVAGGNLHGVSFTVPHAGFVSIKLYTAKGKPVITLVNSFRNAGHYTVNFSKNRVAQGLYILEMDAGSTALSRKITIIK